MSGCAPARLSVPAYASRLSVLAPPSAAFAGLAFGTRRFGNRFFFSTFSPGFFGYYGYPAYYGGDFYSTADYYPSYDYYGFVLLRAK